MLAVALYFNENTTSVSQRVSVADVLSVFINSTLNCKNWSHIKYAPLKSLRIWDYKCGLCCKAKAY